MQLFRLNYTITQAMPDRRLLVNHKRSIYKKSANYMKERGGGEGGRDRRKKVNYLVSLLHVRIRKLSRNELKNYYAKRINITVECVWVWFFHANDFRRLQKEKERERKREREREREGGERERERERES